MEAVSAASNERARKFSALLMQRISAHGQNKIAEEIGVSPPTVSRWASDDLDRACLIVATVGLKVVPDDRICVVPEVYQALVTFASRAMNNPDTVQMLVWED